MAPGGPGTGFYWDNMKHLLLAILLLAASGPARADAPKTYGEAQNELVWLSHDAAGFRKNLREGIKTQTANLEVRRRLEHAKATVEEMIQRDNITKACKVVEVTATVATVGVGGIALAAKEGVSVLTKEGLKIAGKYIAEKGAVEVGKESLGVPGYSDAVKAGVFVFNKFDQNEMQGQLSRDNMELLLKAKQLLEDDSDGRTLDKKLPELRQLLFEAEDRLEKTAAAIAASDKLIEETKAKAGTVYLEAQRLKAKEQKEAEKAAEEAKKAEPKGLKPPVASKPASVPQPAAGPKDTEEERRRKMQSAIDSYIASLRAAIERQQKTADAAWKAMEKPERSGTRYFVADEIEDLYAGLAYLEENLTGVRTYLSMQSAETSAEASAGKIAAMRLALEKHQNDIKGQIEPIVTEVSGLLGQWRSAYDIYKPQGYYVPQPDDIKDMALWSTYYEGPLKYAEGYLNATGGLPEKYRSLAAKAAAIKNAIYAEASELAAAYASKLQAYKDYKPQVVGQLEKFRVEAAKHYEILNSLSHQFVTEFAYDGKYDLANLEAKVTAARPAFAAAQKLYAGGRLLYLDLEGRCRELSQLQQSPLMNEISSIAYSAEDKAHKAAIADAYKRTQGYSPDLNGTEGWQYDLDAGAESMFGAEEALRYLKAQEARLVAAYAKGASAFKANTAGDLSALGTLPDEQYGAAIEKLFAPAQKAEQETAAVIAEVRKAKLFGTQLLEQTGFWTVQAGKKRDELEKATGAFWGSDSGKAISEARRVREVQGAQDKRDPGMALVRKLYEDFPRAYSARDAARVLALVSPDWTAGDGTSVSELEEQLRNVFRINDEVTASLSGLSVTNDGPGRYTAYYNLAIKSRIYKKNIKREETSSVVEKVLVEGGTARILKTDSGGYWEIK